MSAEREALRQQLLLRVLWRDAPPGELAGWTRDAERFTRGLLAYRANAGALAERALAAAYPTLQQLLGDKSFASLARHFWQQSPPERGDVGTWGAGLAGFVAGATDLSAEPYLSDLARLEWAVHGAASAADDSAPPVGLDLLAQADPGALRLLPRPGTALLVSEHPLVTVWQAHRPAAAADPERFVAVREAFAQGRPESALVWRSGWQVEVAALGRAEACFTQQVLGGRTLAVAWQAAAEQGGFDFEAWLLEQLRRGWIAAARAHPCTTPAAAAECSLCAVPASNLAVPPERGEHLP